MPIKNRIAQMHEEITAWRQDIHQHPETGFDTQRTSALVSEKLAEFGVDEVITGIGRTGVVGVIRGRTDTQGRIVGLRADMDALPIEEATGLAYASDHPGKMHACGHDGHTAMLLGAAKYLSETRNFDGTVVVIFQPAEEGAGGGREMVEDGLMDRFGIQEVYGMHNMPGLPTGQFATRPGPLMAGADFFEIAVTGKGGHGAIPHEAVDANLAAAHVVVALQSIASRSVDPLGQVVVSVCAMHSDSTAHNVLPQTVMLRGTVRTLDLDVQAMVVKRFHELAENTARAYGCTAKIDYSHNAPITINAEENAGFASDVAEAVTGSVIRDVTPIMAGEDFAYMLNARPGAYMFIGNGDTAMVHNPAYNFNDAAIPAGCSWFAEMVERRMPVA